MNALFCPFCGKFDADFCEIREEGTRTIKHALQCPTCKATGPHGVTREQALIGWHMREGVPMQIPGGCGKRHGVIARSHLSFTACLTMRATRMAGNA